MVEERIVNIYIHKIKIGIFICISFILNPFVKAQGNAEAYSVVKTYG